MIHFTRLYFRGMAEVAFFHSGRRTSISFRIVLRVKKLFCHRLAQCVFLRCSILSFSSAQLCNRHYVLYRFVRRQNWVPRQDHTSSCGDVSRLPRIYDRTTLPFWLIFQYGLYTTSHKYPPGSAKYPLYPPHEAFCDFFTILAPNFP